MRSGSGEDSEEAERRDRLSALLLSDPARMAVLRAVRVLDLPDCWIGAGFVRNAVWDRLHGRPPSIGTDVDVVWFDPGRVDPSADRALAARLMKESPALDWSVSNQARMHLRNDDAPYRSVADAMRFWPETATAVAVRLAQDDQPEVLAPFGLDDLFGLRLRPTPAFRGERFGVMRERMRNRDWLRRWPELHLLPPGN